MIVPSELSYTPDHEWLDADGDTAKVGITSFAADALGDIVYVELPEVGVTLTAGERCGELESTKSVSDVVAPANGEVLSINQTVVEDPSVVNTDAFGAGWLFTMRITAPADLLGATAYADLIASQ